MKGIILIILMSTSYLSFAQQRSECAEAIKSGKTHLANNELDEALSKFLEALDCAKGAQKDSIKANLTLAFVKIGEKVKTLESEIDSEKTLRENLLGRFFLTDMVRTWAQGANGKYAVIDKEGEILCDSPEKGDCFIWEEPQPFENGRAIAKKGGEYYFVNSEGEIVSNEGYDFIHLTNTGHYLGIQKVNHLNVELVLDFKTGAKKDRIKILREGFDKASEEYFPFEEEGKWGVMDGNGNGYLTEYDTISKFYEGYAMVRLGDKWGFINTNRDANDWGGISYKEIGSFQDSVAWVKDDSDNYKLFIRGGEEKKPKETGKLLLDVYKEYFDRSIRESQWSRNGNNSLNSVQGVNGIETNILFKSKNIGIEKKDGSIENIDLYKLEDKYVVVNAEGRQIYDERFDNVIMQKEKKRLILFTMQRSQMGLLVYEDSILQTTGKKDLVLTRQLPNDYEQIGFYDAGENYIRVKQNGKWGYVFWGEGEKRNEIISTIPCRYDLATKFFDRNGKKVARVYMERFNLYFYIDETGILQGEIQRNKIW